jgi:hypothetical protein
MMDPADLGAQGEPEAGGNVREEGYDFKEEVTAEMIYREKATPAAAEPVDRGRVVVGALLFLAGLACLGFTTIQLARDLSLWIFGTHIEADVVDLWAEAIGESGDGSLMFRYYVRYQFTTADGQVVGGTSTVSPNEWAGAGTGVERAARVLGIDNQGAPIYYEQAGIPAEGIGGMEEGGSIAVVYFAPYPQHNRLEESRYLPLLACGYVPLVIASLAGLLVGWRTLSPALARRRGS